MRTYVWNAELECVCDVRVHRKRSEMKIYETVLLNYSIARWPSWATATWDRNGESISYENDIQLFRVGLLECRMSRHSSIHREIRQCDSKGIICLSFAFFGSTTQFGQICFFFSFLVDW